MPGHVAVAEQRDVLLELEVEAVPPGLEQMRAVAAAERVPPRARAAPATTVTRTRSEKSRACAARLGQPIPRSSAIEGALTALTSSSVWPVSTPSRTSIASGRVALGDAPEQLDLDAVDARPLPRPSPGARAGG
jgi:hypothetical protein